MTDLRVCLVTQWYPPEPIPQPEWIAKALQREGCRVEVVTGIPNYPHGLVTEGYRSWRPGREIREGVCVRRTPLYPYHGTSALHRLLNYASWAISSAVVGSGSLRRSDVALVYSSPATAALGPMLASRLHKTPFVLLIQDVWPDSVFSSGFLTGRLQRLAKWALSRFVNLSYRWASEIVVISPGMRELLADRGVDPAKIRVVYNWVEPLDIPTNRSTALRGSLGIGPDELVVMYAGNHGTAQDLAPVIDAFSTMTNADRCHLVCVGDGVDKPRLVRQAATAGTTNVHFFDPVPREELAGLMAEADVHLVSLRRDPLFAVTLPSKVQSLMSAGVPLLVNVAGDAAEVTRQAGAGVVVPKEAATSLREALLQLREMDREELRAMGRRGRQFYQQHMAEEVGARQLVASLCDATTLTTSQSRG